jgi:hypothetical protein
VASPFREVRSRSCGRTQLERATDAVLPLLGDPPGGEAPC